MDQCLDGGDGLEVLQADEDGQTITVSQEVLLTRQSPAAAFLPFCDERDCYLTMYSHSTDNYLLNFWVEMGLAAAGSAATQQLQL